MNIMPKGGINPYPGLSNDKFFFDTDGDMLELTEVGGAGGGGGKALGAISTTHRHSLQQ